MLIATRDRAMIREIRKAREALSLSVAQPCELGGCEGAGTVVDLAGVEAHGYEWVDGWMDGWMSNRSWFLRGCEMWGFWGRRLS